MSEFMKGDKVRLKKDCFKMPEWNRMRRIERRGIAMIVETDLTVDADGFFMFTFDDHGTCPAASVDKCLYLIPTALLEPVEVVKPVTPKPAILDETHEHKLVAPDKYPVGTKMRVPGHIPGVAFETGDIVTKIKSGCVPWWPDYRSDSDGLEQGCKDEWLEPLTPTLHSYTPEQIAEARDIVYRLMTESRSGLLRVTCSPRDMRTNALRFEQNGGSYIEYDNAVAYCQPNDVWSDDIGRLVALCKLLGEKLPDWVKGGKSK